MSQDDYLAGLVKAAKQVCQTEQSINLNADETMMFFNCRKDWGHNGIAVVCQEGELVQLDLPSFPLPVRTSTLEWYTTEDGVEIVPKFQYHSIVNFFLRRWDMNLIPQGTRT